jgi:hypothetical protein
MGCDYGIALHCFLGMLVTLVDGGFHPTAFSIGRDEIGGGELSIDRA